MSAKITYQITYLAGKWVAGYRLPLGATTIELTPEEAEYDLRAGTLVAPGQPLPTQPYPAVVESTDVIDLVRAGGTRSATVADLVAYLVDAGAVATGQSTALDALLKVVRGSAGPEVNTLGKIAAIVAGLGVGDIAGLDEALAEKATLADIDAAQLASDLASQILPLPGDPATADIASGTVRATKNRATGRISLWANDGGKMVDLLTLASA